MKLDHIEPERIGVPRPQVVCSRTSKRHDGRRLVVDKIAETSDRGRERGERQRAGDLRTTVSLPLVDDEVGLVHELEGKDLIAQVGPQAAVAVAPNQG